MTLCAGTWSLPGPNLGLRGWLQLSGGSCCDLLALFCTCARQCDAPGDLGELQSWLGKARLWGACSPDQHPLLAASGRHVQTHELGVKTSFELAQAIMWL